MSIRLDGGRLLPENEEEAVRAAFKGRGHINITGYDDPDRWGDAMEKAKELAEKDDKEFDFEALRPRLPFEAFAKQLGLTPMFHDVGTWLGAIASKKSSPGGGAIQGALTSDIDDSIWVVEHEFTTNEYWLRFCADNIYDIPDRYNLDHHEWFYPGVVKAECSWRGGPWPKGGTLICEFSSLLLGRDVELLTYAKVRGPGDFVTHWSQLISNSAERAPNTHSVAGVFDVLYEPPHLFSGLKDPILRKFLAGPNAPSSRVYKFLRTMIKEAIERDLLNRFGVEAGIPEALIKRDNTVFEDKDLQIEISSDEMDNLFRRAGIKNPEEKKKPPDPIDF